jgi:hypothetical protein
MGLSASRPGRAFSPGERTPGTHCTGGWVASRACLDTETGGKVICLCRGTNPDRSVCGQRQYCLSYPGSETLCSRHHKVTSTRWEGMMKWEENERCWSQADVTERAGVTSASTWKVEHWVKHWKWWDDSTIIGLQTNSNCYEHCPLKFNGNRK